MLRVAIGQSEGVHTHSAISDVLAQCEEQLQGQAPQAGILLVTGEFDEPVLLEAVAARFPGVPIIGGTAWGAMSGHGGYGEDSISLLLLASDTLAFSVGVGRHGSRDIDACVQEALDHARRGLPGPPRLCIALPEAQRFDANTVIQRLSARLDQGCALFGGALGLTWSFPGDDDRMRQFFGTEVLDDALLLLLIAGPVEYAFSIENSWSPVGERQPVTRSLGREVLRIGERTALAFYQHYLGSHTRPALEFPLAVFEGDGSDHYMRVPRTYDADTGAIHYSGPVPEGATVQLTEAVRSRMLERTEASVRRAAKALGGATPALVLVASCGIRRLILGTQVRREAEIVQAVFPSVPSFGLYASSEIAPLAPGRPSVLHQTTLVTLVLGVRDQPRAWTPPAASAAPRAPDLAYVQRKLWRSDDFRARLEEAHERDHALLRTIGQEIERSRELIRQQNDELRRLYDELEREKKKSDELLLNILPRDVADELKRTGHVEPVYYESVTVLFTDFKDFARISAHLSPRDLIRELDHFFSEFDRISERHGLEKLKTIGDAYMCAGGIPTPRTTHALDAVRAAWDIQAFMRRTLDERRAIGGPCWELRIGIHTGPLMAGVIGNKKFAYDIWGDTVNIAARMESSGAPGRINISRTTYEQVRQQFVCEARGTFALKNAGEIDMFFVVEPY